MIADAEPLEVALETPANPAFFLLHIRRHLTDAMVEKYNRTSMARAPHWVQVFFTFQPISNVHVMRHRVRFRTYKKAYDWTRFEGYLLERLLPESLGKVRVTQLVASDLRRSYPTAISFDEPLVVEGRTVSKVHPFTAAVYAIDGVVELVCRSGELVVKRSPLYGFDEIERQLRPLLKKSY